ncbi:MAG: adenylyl-sulfate kinase [Caldilineaceae bacterium]
MTTASGWAVWLTGLPASGKTTIAHAVQDALWRQQVHSVILDSDELRAILTPQATYTSQERDQFYDGVVRLAELLNRQQINVLIAATGHRRIYRQMAREQLPRFYEIWVRCPIDVCRQRDPKGLYARAMQQKESTLPGAGVQYEPPLAPTLIIDAETQLPTAAAEQIIATCALATGPVYKLPDR